MQGGTLPIGGDSYKREQEIEEEDKGSNKHAKCVDYHYLDDPFQDEFKEQETFAISPSNELESLEEAKRSPEWPEWEKAIKIELDQLSEMGTWKMIDKLIDAIPISSKWVFIKKMAK